MFTYTYVGIDLYAYNRKLKIYKEQDSKPPTLWVKHKFLLNFRYVCTRGNSRICVGTYILLAIYGTAQR